MPNASAYQNESPKLAQRIEEWSHGTDPPLWGPISPPHGATPGRDKATVRFTATAIALVTSSLLGEVNEVASTSTYSWWVIPFKGTRSRFDSFTVRGCECQAAAVRGLGRVERSCLHEASHPSQKRGIRPCLLEAVGVWAKELWALGGVRPELHREVVENGEVARDRLASVLRVLLVPKLKAPKHVPEPLLQGPFQELPCVGRVPDLRKTESWSHRFECKWGGAIYLRELQQAATLGGGVMASVEREPEENLGLGGPRKLEGVAPPRHIQALLGWRPRRARLTARNGVCQVVVSGAAEPEYRMSLRFSEPSRHSCHPCS